MLYILITNPRKPVILKSNIRVLDFFGKLIP